MGRPRLYFTEEEAKQARKRQTKLHVRAYRERKKASASDASTLEGLSLDIAVTRADNDDGSPDSLELMAKSPIMITDSPQQVQSPTLMPQELKMDSNAMVTSLLWQDFIQISGIDLSWWPYESTHSDLGLDISGDVALPASIAGQAYCVAMWNRNPGLVYMAELSYGDALSKLRAYVRESAPARDAVRIVVGQFMLEMFESARQVHEVAERMLAVRQGQPWIEPESHPATHHVHAAAEIMQEAGPEVFAKGVGARVLLGMIPKLMVYACKGRYSLFLTSADWLRMLVAMPKPHVKDAIAPLAVQIPSLMQRYDEIIACHALDTGLDDMVSLHIKVLELEKALDEWMKLFLDTRSVWRPGSMKGAKLWWISTSVAGTNEIFTAPLDFATHSIAEVSMIFFTSKLQLAILQTDIESFIGSAESESSRDKATEFANQICQGGTYWIRSSACAEALIHCFSFPLRVAAEWFERIGCDRELEGCIALSESMKAYQRFGFTAEHLVSGIYGSLPSRINIVDLPTRVKEPGLPKL